ncbi:MAG TPA: response regulator transcription factor [Thermoleophilaceae bacterium]|nr:response regulator transcription factor [Thermoleophilaceae bacterium]
MTPPPATVVVCDDVPELRRLARAVLEEEGEFDVVGEAGDGREAVELIERLQPSVAVLDLSMPELDGLEAIPIIHRVSPTTEIVVFSGFEEGKVAQLALSLKASRYVRKGAPLEDLRTAVRELAAGAA